MFANPFWTILVGTMKQTRLWSAFFAVLTVTVAAAGQGSVVINDPTTRDPNEITDKKYKLAGVAQKAMETQVLPKVRARLAGDACQEEIVLAGWHQGSFTAANKDQTAIFYQFCETGNGLGSAGVAILENGKVVGNFVAENAGWANDSAVLPDINKNGIDELALYYSGGMHQGAGGTGVDIVEFPGGKPTGLGWYQSDGFGETGPQWAWKVTVEPGKTPVFFKEKYLGTPAGKWRRSGKVLPLKLGEIVGPFEAIK